MVTDSIPATLPAKVTTPDPPARTWLPNPAARSRPQCPAKMPAGAYGPTTRPGTGACRHKTTASWSSICQPLRTPPGQRITPGPPGEPLRSVRTSNDGQYSQTFETQRIRMTTRIGLMGFGRIGRNVFRFLVDHPDLEVMAIADIADPAGLTYLLKYDSLYGRFPQPV
ncbi:MAG TPA: glyceraldehyde 3-phosphate dehydrogenase NAD-binding domain-containing protein, partial [Acidimicrobiia bacterium]|nr:glyceraldehyde 3-phosphate dehydrogenase NAD-binding domain-containing protein [Acidimicrobiia bacterium]